MVTLPPTLLRCFPLRWSTSKCITRNKTFVVLVRVFDPAECGVALVRVRQLPRLGPAWDGPALERTGQPAPARAVRPRADSARQARPLDGGRARSGCIGRASERAKWRAAREPGFGRA